ncbi:MAG: hypothetical protein SVZ03_07185 [Spirochaetota bacterium]|nr:hypothetical protein [Spirochaetota bacterium]
MRLQLLVIHVILFLSCSSNPHYFLRDGKKFPLIMKVAVLPFKNITTQRGAGKVVTNIFIQELFNSRIYKIEEMGIIRDFFIRQRIREKGEIDLDTANLLGSQIDVDAVFLGIVEEYYQDAGGKEGISPRVGLSVRMLSTKTGMILWKCSHQRTGDDYKIILDWGKVRTVNLLAKKVIEEMIATIRKHGKE